MEKYKLFLTNRFLKDLKLATKRGFDKGLLNEVVKMLLQDIKLPSRYKNHRLKGNYKDYFECHITPNWLLI